GRGMVTEEEDLQVIFKRSRRGNSRIRRLIGLYRLNVPVRETRRLINLLVRLYRWLVDGWIVVVLIDLKRLDRFPAAIGRRRRGEGIFMRITSSRVVVIVELRHRLGAIGLFKFKRFE